MSDVVNPETVGLLLGAFPGLALLLRNMWRGHMLQKRIETVAWADHDWRNTQTSRGQMAKIMRNPEGYVGASDSPALVTAKRELLAVLPILQRRQWLFITLMLGGGALGSIAGSFLA